MARRAFRGVVIEGCVSGALPVVTLGEAASSGGVVNSGSGEQRGVGVLVGMSCSHLYLRVIRLATSSCFILEGL